VTTVSYPLGKPLSAPSRGGDCRARDLRIPRNVHGPHRFDSPEHCQIDNGMLQVTVSAAGTVPTLTIDAWRGAVVVDDVYNDTYHDLYSDGGYANPDWLDAFAVTIDSPSVSAVLTGVKLAHICDELVVIRLIVPAIADAYVRLRRGEPMIHIQHGETRPPLLDIDRRVALTASPSPAGTASTGRVEEASPLHDGAPRFVASIDAVTTGAFSLTASSVVSARFGAGMGTYAPGTRPIDLHRQLGDASWPVLVVAEDEDA
jgi:hypothetical protein